METTQTNHQLLAIRLKWLNWLSMPIVACWIFIVDSLSYLWTIIKLPWMAMKESINYRYWVLATISGSVMVFVVLLSAYFGRRSGEIDILYIGTFLSVLAISWTYAEIANFIRYKEQHGMDIELKSMKGQPGNGLKTIRFFSLYVATIIILLLATVLEI